MVNTYDNPFIFGLTKDKYHLSSMRKLRPMNHRFSQNDEYWNAIKSHNFRYDFRFYYAKRTSNNYCRPSCKTPKKFANITDFTWFGSIEEAESLEYVPCQKCHANDPSYHGIEARKEMIADAIDTAVEKGKKIPTGTELSQRFNISLSHLQRTAKQNKTTYFQRASEMKKSSVKNSGKVAKSKKNSSK